MSEEVLTDERISGLKIEFAAFDREGNGLISAVDLVALLRCIGMNPTKSECEVYKEKYGSSGSVDFSSVMNLVQSLGWDYEGELNSLVAAFAEFDTDKSGTLDVTILRQKLASNGEDKLQREELDDFISLVEVTDGKINYNELAKAMCTMMKA